MQKSCINTHYRTRSLEFRFKSFSIQQKQTEGTICNIPMYIKLKASVSGFTGTSRKKEV